MKALCPIRLDCSDAFLFENAAQGGEWAVSGAFVFASIDPSRPKGKARAAFRGDFLGIDSLGWSTPVQERFAAPDPAMARAAAEQEIDFAVSLADHPSGMLAAIARMSEGGSIREGFRSLRPAANMPTSACALLQASREDEQPAEEVDLLSLARRVAR